MKSSLTFLVSVVLLFSPVAGPALAAKYTEAPALAALVKAGKLPPVEERLPKEPLVAEIRAKDGKIGKYGGVLRRATWDPMFAVALRDLTPLLIAQHSWSIDVYPNVARSYEMKDGGREWIIHLREGLKWSDGHPYTVDDIMFCHEDVHLNKEYTPAVSPLLISGGEVVNYEKLDDYTFSIRAKEPYLIENLLQTFTGILWETTRHPKHYLKQFHPKYVGREKAEALAKELGFPTWIAMFENRADPSERNNPEKPSLEPWVLTRAPPDNTVVFKRNPYYWAVDKEGNQLPYINEMQWDVCGNTEVVKLKALAGEVDHTRLQDIINYPMFKKAEKEGKVKVFIWASTYINALELEFNLNHKDPGMRKLFLDKRFRFAASYAINREMINQMVWLGMAEPWQIAPYETSRFYNERLAHVALEYDPDKANKLLDEIGLDKRDADGHRLRPDGKRLDITLALFEEPSVREIAEIVAENLQDVGLNVTFRFFEYGFWSQLRDSNSHDAALVANSWATNEGIFLSGNANHLVPVARQGFWAPEWVKWYRTTGKDGIKPVPEMIRALEAYDRARSTLDPQEQEKWFKVVTDIAADNLWCIGTNKHPGYVQIINPKLRNVPQTFHAWHRGDWGRPDLWYYED